MLTRLLLVTGCIPIGLEPESTRGITQRIASSYLFAWYGLAAFAIVRASKADQAPQAAAA